MLHFAYKYGNNFEHCLLANANTGGENVARGQVLGALLGCAIGATRIPAYLKDGLPNAAKISQDIDAFIASITCAL